jgi:hypothetical protein
MGHKNENISQSLSNKVKSISLNLQTRPFATPEIQEKTSENDLVQPVREGINFSENILEKLIATPQTISNIGIQRKPRKHFAAVKETKITIQPKLNIGEPDDKYEKEADKTAEAVVDKINTPSKQSAESLKNVTPKNSSLTTAPVSSTVKSSISVKNQPVQRQEVIEEEQTEEDQESLKKFVISPEPPPIRRNGIDRNLLRKKPLIQRRENVGGGEASSDLEASIQSARGRGQALDNNLQAKMGQAMGADFSSVKVHTDSQSDQLNKSIQAKAFTTGQDVFFRQGSYDPSSRSGQELIAHELTHVVQQNSSAVQRKKIVTGLNNAYTSSLLQTTRERSNAFSGGNPPNITSSEVDKSSSPFLPEYEDDEVPGWKDEDEGVAEWAQEEYKRDSKRTVICSMTTDQKIGSVYFQDGGRIRTTHGAGPEKESHSHQTRLQFNIDENLAIPEFEKAKPKAKQSKHYWNYFDKWLVATLKDITVEQAPSWAKLVDKPDSANDLPTDEVKLFEIFKNINGEVESWHPSRGTATKFETDKQVISVLEAAIQHIAKTKDPKQRNIEFYEFVKSRLPKFVDYMRRPDEVN